VQTVSLYVRKREQLASHLPQERESRVI
jgi:hypothetical protein